MYHTYSTRVRVCMRAIIFRVFSHSACVIMYAVYVCMYVCSKDILVRESMHMRTHAHAHAEGANPKTQTLHCTAYALHPQQATQSEQIWRATSKP